MGYPPEMRCTFQNNMFMYTYIHIYIYIYMRALGLMKHRHRGGKETPSTRCWVAGIIIIIFFFFKMLSLFNPDTHPLTTSPSPPSKPTLKDLPPLLFSSERYETSLHPAPSLQFQSPQHWRSPAQTLRRSDQSGAGGRRRREAQRRQRGGSFQSHRPRGAVGERSCCRRGSSLDRCCRL